MNKTAILHIPLSEYAFAINENTLTIRIRAGKDDLTSCTLYYGDRACNSTPVKFFAVPMSCVGGDELFSYYEANIESEYNRICYYFKLEKNSEWYYYYADHFTKELADVVIDNHIIEGRSEYYQYPFILRNEIVDVPEWFKNAIVYNIFPDSFANGKQELIQEKKELQVELRMPCSETLVVKSALGGTIKGIMENVDYIKEMGFNCIYLNPIFVAGESHKYDILDYKHIDPCFGTDKEFKELVELLHKKQMRIIIDGVFNHCSWYFFAFDDVVKYGKDSIYADWFYQLEFPVKRPSDCNQVPNYSCFAYERKMPKLNTSNPKVQDYFAGICEYWLKEYGVDGWRLDVANEIDRNFWRRFRETTKKCNPNAVLIGEVWENSSTWLRGDAFDSTMNYDFRKHCRDFFALDEINAQEFCNRMQQMYLRYPKNISLGQLNLLDSHDVPRFLSLCGKNTARLKLALITLMLFPGVPSVFYGDEREVSGILESEYRQAMPWNRDSELVTFITKLIALRKEYIAPEDSFEITTLANNSNVVVLSRDTSKGKLSAYLNRSETPIELAEQLGQQKADRHTILLEEGLDGGALIGGFGYVVRIV